MKRIVLLVLFGSFITFCQAQNWPPKDAEWIFTVPNMANNPYYDFQIYKHEKDTVIDGKTCSIIAGRHSRDILYEENNRIYYYFLDSFNLLYDFNKTVGDTVVYSIRSYKIGSWMRYDSIREVICFVEEVDTLDFGNVKLKSFQTKVLNYDPDDLQLVWPPVYNYIERIGHTYRFIFDIPVPSTDHNNNLRCYKDAEIDFVNPWWEILEADCKTAYWNDINDEEGITLLAYPNPANNFLTIDFTNKNCQAINVEIFNSSGKLVHSEQTNDKQIVVSVNELNAGLYFFKLSSATEIIGGGKFVK